MGKARRFALVAWVLGCLGLVLVIASLGWLRAGYLRATVPSDSMSPTYAVGDGIVAERVGGDEVRRGDVVLYSAPERYRFAESVMQRVVGVGGDRVVCCASAGSTRERITVNGKPLHEPYVKDGIADGLHRPYDVTVPEGRLFLLGDHRLNSMDSRFFADDRGGTVPVGAVEGRVTDDYAVPVLLAAGALLGSVLALAGVVFGIAARTVRRRAATQSSLWPEPL
ncbi:signal peptidase I [Streptomyces sp. NL15-2K]|uniref:signal peptidase I n=1 Tax=Streptomyces sp. NL15-2K TaxID=376149 RepID=UPI000F560BA1|nr:MULTISPECIES: signal peptidase I [Actinomycetes]WKX09665.1 signal peptidase I [Kutzneria buriramensis]GCB48806.1 signal peptidase I [Streptomyces sp. NL15-2K]